MQISALLSYRHPLGQRRVCTRLRRLLPRAISRRSIDPGDAIPSPFQGASILRFTHMASTTITTNPQPLSTTSHSRQNHLNHARSISSASGVYDDQDSPITRPNPSMSFSMSQGSQGSGLMMQPGGPFRQSDGYNGVNRRNSAPQIYSVRIFSPLS